MGDRSRIEWTDATWNPVTGCTKVSPGCDHCYAESIATRFAGTPHYPNGFQVTLRPERLDQPLRWTKPRRVFVCSMADLFHADVPDKYIARVFAVMALAHQHTFQVLTKRPARMRALLSSPSFGSLVCDVGRAEFIGCQHDWLAVAQMLTAAPLPNVWVGVSAEDQRWMDIRLPTLLATPAAIRFVSAEPLLGPIHHDALQELDWLIVGGESGPHPRPIDPAWVRDLRDQALAAGVSFHFKQWGGHTPKAGGRQLDGRTWDQYPGRCT